MNARQCDAVEKRLTALARLRHEPDSEAVASALRAALRDRSSQVVARAARLASELRRSDLGPELVTCFLLRLDDPGERDPGCVAKTALAAALVDLELPEVEALRRGSRVRQWEPVYGGRVDVAAELRAHCAVGLAASAAPEVMTDLADLLADPEPVARCAAVRAIAACGRLEGPLLLRFKARLGDRDPEVLGETFAALLEVDPEGSLEVVAEALDDPDDTVAEAAALALGGSRGEAAFPLLRTAVEKLVHGGRRRTLLTAIALSRDKAALGYLVELVADGPVGTAVDAVEALSVLRHDRSLASVVDAAVRRRGDERVAEALHAAFAAG